MESQRPLGFLKTLTPTLAALVDQYQRTLPAAEFEDFVAHVRALHAETAAAISRHKPGADRARAVQALMEEAMAPSLGAPTTCSRGCSACCHLEVEITRDEGELLASLVRQGHPIDRARLEEQASRERRSAAWASLVSPENRCVMLGDDGACTVYASRPSACRKLVVLSHPIECATLGGKPEPFVVPLAELVLSTALSLPDNPYASLSKSLLAALRAS